MAATKTKAKPAPAIKASPVPSRNRSIPELIEHQRKSFERRDKARKAEAGLTVTVPETKPYGIALVGDPHLDNPGCNWPQLLNDIGTIAGTPGLYSILLGDVIDNWPTGGKLAKKWADAAVTRSESYMLAEWLYGELAPRLLLTIAGNHDTWDNGGEILSRVHNRAIPFADWSANVTIAAKKGKPVKAVIRHDFPGHSFWNITHAGLRAARLDYDAELLVSGHRHQYGSQQIEVHRSASLATVVAAGSYKTDDEYSIKCGYRPSTMAATTMVIVDPNAARPEDRLTHFASLSMGAKVLAALRR
jgi:hypothetical protein